LIKKSGNVGETGEDQSHAVGPAVKNPEQSKTGTTCPSHRKREKLQDLGKWIFSYTQQIWQYKNGPPKTGPDPRGQEKPNRGISFKTA